MGSYLDDCQRLCNTGLSLGLGLGRKERKSASVVLKFDQVLPSLSLEEEEASPRKKLRLTKDQSAVLEGVFKQHCTLNPNQKQSLAKQLNLRPRQVEVWFQNRRARTKLKQTEMDCDVLKKCCERLTEENRRLKREVEELKFGPVFMQVGSASTLSVCPSCDRGDTRHRYADQTSSTAFVSGGIIGTKPPPPTLFFHHSSAAC